MIYKYKGKVVVADSMKEACNILSISKEELMKEGKEVSFTLKGAENEPEAKTGRGYTQRVNEWTKDSSVDKMPIKISCCKVKRAWVLYLWL